MFVGPLQTVYASSQSGKTTAINGMTYVGTIKNTFGARGVLLKFYNSYASATGVLSVTTAPAWGEATASTASFPPLFATTTASGGTTPNWAQGKANSAIFLVTPTVTGVSAIQNSFGFLTPFIHVSASSTVSAITASAGGGAGPICEAFVLYDDPSTMEASNSRGLF